MKGDVAIPCSWSTCGCVANGEKLLSCADLPAQCGMTLLEKRTVHRHHRGSGFLQKTAGMAFIAAAMEGDRHHAEELDRVFPEL